jgi:hypothetical protein
MVTEHIKDMVGKTVKDADGNPTTPEKLHVERVLEEPKRAVPETAHNIQSGVRLPARCAKNEPPYPV